VVVLFAPFLLSRRVEEGDLPYLARGRGIGSCHTLGRVNTVWLRQTNQPR
jgi:hypothetical protein